VIVLHSGGVDSSTLLLHARDLEWTPVALSFDYGQTHRVELEYAARFCEHHGIERQVVQMPGVFTKSALTGDLPIPSGHYTDESMKQTVVPNRNMVMLSIATAIAISRGVDSVAYAAHADDRSIYPDCREEFIEAMRSVMALCDYSRVRLWTPFAGMLKAEIIRRGRTLGIDYSMTWSCYAGGDTPCGTCGACSARSISMENA
jgi:7-cyano-7-deazaguanine synthase